MIDRIKRLFAAAGSPMPNAVPAGESVDELHFAAAALLAEVALSDDDGVDDAERSAIRRLMSTRFGLSEGDSTALVAAAEAHAADSVHLIRFTRVIKDNYTPQERIELIEMIWEVVYADGVLHDHEDSLLRRIAGLIYVSDRDRGEARKRVLARLAAAKPD
ncbi:MAG: TerB family tellurite resistance protein [Proteobacteria bacterium]|nr:TerB family tellurite resistance protein [Pseudomonadota bacterium]